MNPRMLLFTALLGAFAPWNRAPGADFTATQTAYSALQGKNTVLLEWTDSSPSPGVVTIRRDSTVIATVAGASGDNAYAAEDVPLGQFSFSAESSSGPLGSQLQTVIADHNFDASGDPFFGNPTGVVCAAQESDGDCEIVIDWESGSPPPGAYDVSLDGEHQLSQNAFPVGATLPATTAGEHCVTVSSFMARTEGNTQGRFRGEPVETCCDVPCGAAGCPAPEEFSVAQAKYAASGAQNAVLARWKLPGGRAYAAGIKTSLRGAEVGAIPGDATRNLFEGLTIGTYELSVQGDCGAPSGLSGMALDLITLLPETPHKNPVSGSPTCEWIAAEHKTVAAWTNADPSASVDVYINESGARSFVTTLPGDAATVTVHDTGPADRIELQFFALAGRSLYGSEVVACEPGGSRFVSGVCGGASGKPGISDPIFGLNYLFLGGASPPCLKACDANADGKADLSDMVYILNYLFIGGPPPRSWGGPDPVCETAPAEACEAGNAACAG